MEIHWLGHPACHVVAAVGGKAANLSRLTLHHSVPPGFCLPASAWQHARPLVRAHEHHLPEPLQAILTDAYHELAARCGHATLPVAVRSSAVDEDGALASFAGQHETYLNVVGAAAVGQAVARCWSSGQVERALAYRRHRGLPVDGVGLAVLIQQLVPADVSAVVFSANPVSGSRQEIVITANWGLGETIVGGTVSPDTYVVRKDTMQVVSRELGHKARMTVMTPGGTREADVPRWLRGQLALSDAQAIEAARLALTLEETMGWPVDVECAWHRGHLYLLQCRPITTLGPGVTLPAAGEPASLLSAASMQPATTEQPAPVDRGRRQARGRLTP
jgi:pyruvate,water dikinase